MDNIKSSTETFKQEWDTKQAKFAAWRAQKGGSGSTIHTARSDTSSRASTASMATFASPSVFNAPGAIGARGGSREGARGEGGYRGHKVFVPPLQLKASSHK